MLLCEEIFLNTEYLIDLISSTTGITEHFDKSMCADVVGLQNIYTKQKRYKKDIQKIVRKLSKPKILKFKIDKW